MLWLGPPDHLDAQGERTMASLMSDFEQSGIHLPPATQAKVVELCILDLSFEIIDLGFDITPFRRHVAAFLGAMPPTHRVVYAEIF